MRHTVEITEAVFLSKRSIMLTMEKVTPGGGTTNTFRGQCEIPWVVEMFRWINGNILGTDAAPKAGIRIPADVRTATGSMILSVRIRMEEEFSLRGILTVWAVMRS